MEQVTSASFFSFFHEIDEKDALLHFDGSFEIFLKILRKYCSDSSNNISKITTAFNAGNYPEYIILVHALKSTTASIGNNSLANHAKEHEFAGKDGNYGYIENDFNNLIFEYTDFANKLKAYITSNFNDLHAAENSINADNSHIRGDELGTAIKEAIDAIDNFETDEAVCMLNRLLTYNIPDSYYTCITGSLNHIEEYEYEEAIATLNSLLQ